MYEQFFGLERSPFGINPDPQMLYPMDQTKEAFSGLLHGILNRKGFVLLTGDSGTGKTTLLRAVLSQMRPDRVCSSLIFNPTLTADEFVEMAMYDFGIEEVEPKKVKRLLQLQKFLIDANAQGKTCVIFADEAHKLSPEVLEEIRLLTNLENENGKLLQIVLAGHDELDQILEQREFRQLKQRIAIRVALRPLTPIEVVAYMNTRWQKARSAVALPFQPEALARVASLSSGIPRLINVICDNALLLAFASDSATVTESMVFESARDLRLTVEGPRQVVQDGGIRSQILVGDMHLPDATTQIENPVALSAGPLRADDSLGTGEPVRLRLIS